MVLEQKSDLKKDMLRAYTGELMQKGMGNVLMARRLEGWLEPCGRNSRPHLLYERSFCPWHWESQQARAKCTSLPSG